MSDARAGLLSLALLAGAVAAQPETARHTRMAWWREARFGMFVHWGLYAIPAGRWDGKRQPAPAEWILHHARIRVADYEPLLAQWNPQRFDADAWARIAREAGMRYVVITSKHHDGFALWDSAVSDWDVGAATDRTDILAELAAACRRHGLRFGLYHSILDWHHPDYVPRREWDPRPGIEPEFTRYVTYLKAQLRELIERYDPDVLWFDGEWEESWTHELGLDVARFVRELKPDLIVNNRVDKGRSGMAGLDRDGEWAGDFGTPEQEIPSRGLPGVDWESCMTMNDTWGYSSDDQNWKSPTVLVHNLVEIVSKGGNYLLNVGPQADGAIPAASVERLAAIGAWMARHGESIHGCGATPFTRAPWFCTTKPGRLYVHLFERPADGRVELVGLRNAVKRAWWLGDEARTALAVGRNEHGPVVELPDPLPDPIDSVLVVEIEGNAAADPIPLRPDAEGRMALRAADADVRGGHARFERDKQCIGYWTDAKDQVQWEFELPAAQKMRVTLEVACPADSAGSTFALRVGGTELRGEVPATGAWTIFRELALGELELPAGAVHLAVVPLQKPGLAVMNLRGIRLEPVR